jgi:glutathione synthase/RimK-type ligase-like ATP-grasp enzyme
MFRKLFALTSLLVFCEELQKNICNVGKVTGMGAVLLGNTQSLRTAYFLRAAKEAAVPVSVMSFPAPVGEPQGERGGDVRSRSRVGDDSRTEFPQNALFDPAAPELPPDTPFAPKLPPDTPFAPELLRGKFLKIDPPDFGHADLRELEPDILRYRLLLARIARIPGIRPLNSCESILRTMDKLACKQTLRQAGLRVTPVMEDIRSTEELRARLRERKQTGAFVKPRFGAGAAGILAYRHNPKTGEELLYTAVLPQNGGFFNTKKIRRITDKETCARILGELFAHDVLVETWVPKASCHSKSFDLRVVVQFGRVSYMLARQSDGHITNLHLNNAALPIDELALSRALLSEIEALCVSAVSLFPGLNYAGVDVLLEKDTLRPHIIEINGQGDFIHRDIYSENRIYRDQIRYLKAGMPDVSGSQRFHADVHGKEAI